MACLIGDCCQVGLHIRLVFRQIYASSKYLVGLADIGAFPRRGGPAADERHLGPRVLAINRSTDRRERHWPNVYL
jgi:hypothetical protein